MFNETNKDETSYTYWVWLIPEKREDDRDRRYLECELRVGEDGVTQEWIDLLKAMDHKEELKDRYAKEATAYDVPAELTADFSYTPESLLFPEPLQKALLSEELCEELRDVIETELEPQQQDTLYQYYFLKIRQADIAKAEGVSSAAIAKRRKRICSKLKKSWLKSIKFIAMRI